MGYTKESVPNPFGPGSSQPSSTPSDNSGGTGGYGGYGGGGGGGGGGSGPTDEQKEAFGNLGGITGYNQESITNKAGQGDKIFDVSDKQNKLMRDTQTKQNLRNAGNDWYTQQQKLQSVASQLADASGNAMYGSFYQDLNDLIARKDDMDDVEVLNQMRKNQNQIDNDYWEAIMANNNARNELYMDTEYDLRELAADYAAQGNNIHPDLVKDIIDSDGHTLNIPDWLKTSYFDDHFRQAVEPDTQGLYRPENAAADAKQNGLVNKDTTGQNASAGNTDYWSRVRQGYARRTQ